MGPREMRIMSAEGSTMRNFVICTVRLIYPTVVRVIMSRIFRQAGHVIRMEEDRSAFRILTDKPPRERPLGRPRR